jgi:TM2 domain-containing membrane protein YozV
MNCPYCGLANEDNATSCTGCGAPLLGAAATGAPVPPPQYSAAPPQQPPRYGAIPTPGSKSKVAAGLFGILLGGLGIHKFYLGYTKEGVIWLLISLLGGLFTLGIATIVMEVIGLIEGIIYLTKSDEEFYNTYVLNKKAWF